LNGTSTHTAFTNSGTTTLNGTVSGTGITSLLSPYVLTSSLSSYLTSTTAASTYQTITGMSTYLTSATATSTYQTISGMSSYLTSATAASTYGTLTALANILNGTSSHTAFTCTGLANILELSETVASVAVSSSVATCSYSSGAVFYITGQTANFTLALTNLTPSANKTFSVTLLINASTNKFYANALTIAGTSTSFIYNGGSASVSVSSANTIIQQFNLVYTSSTSAPAFVISSISQAY
jgi:hypothetical protein